MNKKILRSTLVFAFALLVSVCFGKVDAKASITNLTQTDAQKTSVTVTWIPDADASSYNVYYKAYGESEFTLAGNTVGATYTIANLKPATDYDVKIMQIENGTEDYGKSIYNVVTLPDAMPGLEQKKWWYYIKKLDVCWERQSAADGFEIRLYDDKGKKKKALTLSGSSTDASFSVNNSKVYKVQVRSFVDYNGQRYYSKWKSIYCLNQPMIKSVKVKGNKLNVKWGKISGSTQYKVYVSTKKSTGYKKVATVSKKKTSCTVKKFKGKKFSPKKTYYVYIQAVCNKGGTKNTSGALYTWNSKTGSMNWQ